MSEGVCVGQEESGALCVQGGWLCAFDWVDTYESVETSCDGLDNDCDGLVDEGLSQAFALDQVFSHELLPAHRHRWPGVATGEGGALLYGGLYSDGMALDGGTLRIPLGDLWRLDPDGSSWMRLTPEGASPGARWDHALMWDASLGLLLVHGGLGSVTPDEAALDDLWAYDLASSTWHEVSQAWESVGAGARSGHTLSSLGPGSLLMAGGSFSAPTFQGTLT
jgi:hypothetical protein